MQNRLKEKYMNEVQKKLLEELGLKNKLMTTMQSEEQWARATGKVKAETAPLNFQQIFYLEPLKIVSPASVEL